MKTLNINHIINSIVHPVRIAIPVFQGLACHFKNFIMKGPRFFIPRDRKYYYPREEAAHKAAMEMKKNNFPGQGPPL